MITISNAHLKIEIIDPIADRARTGSRYCTGGYIWQVYDGAGRALLSGPRYPDPTPPVFDGQGMPEAFETPLGGSDGAVGDNVCVIGVGLVRKSSDIEPFHPRNNPEVILPCKWDIDRGDDFVVMTTEQSCRGGRHRPPAQDSAISSDTKQIQLRREVRLVNNVIESVNTINNTGDIDVDIRWFAHPFFPLDPNLTCGKITPETSSKISLPDNAGYEIQDNGMIRMKQDYPWEKGLFQPIEVPAEKLTFTIPHPIAQIVQLQTDYPVIRCPIWANANTFSFEPFTSRTIKPSENTTWGIKTCFDFDVTPEYHKDKADTQSSH